ncbi:MAG: phage major capsid protein [Phycisphaeraceae bacterium]|nr:phage major capsid protein [Phycisphaeraceae bacterium]
METKKTLALDVFRSQVLPLLSHRHGGGESLKKGLERFTSQTQIVDDDGVEVSVEAMLPEDGDAAAQAGDIDEARIEQLVRKALDGMKESAGVQTKARGIAARTPASVSAQDTGRFDSFGQFALAVHKAAAKGGNIDERLITKAPSTFANEGAGDSGGYLVPPQWADRIWRIVVGEESLLSRTNQIPTTRNALSLPVSQSTPWGTGGVQAYWTDEGGTISQSAPKFEYRNLRLNKLATLVPARDELLEDSAALDAFIVREAGRAIRYKSDDAIVNGDGVGKPLGILNSAVLVTVSKESEQDANTVLGENVAKMYARMPSGSINRAVWLMNQDVLPQLLTMSLGNQPIYLPPNGIADAPFGTLLGRPVLLSQHCQTLGDKGDILFADLSQYLTLTKAGGINATSSMHLWFDYDVTAFRFTFRLAGQPWLSSSIDVDNGSASLSPFIALESR